PGLAAIQAILDPIEGEDPHPIGRRSRQGCLEEGAVVRRDVADPRQRLGSDLSGTVEAFHDQLHVGGVSVRRAVHVAVHAPAVLRPLQAEIVVERLGCVNLGGLRESAGERQEPDRQQAQPPDPASPAHGLSVPRTWPARPSGGDTEDPALRSRQERRHLRCPHESDVGMPTVAKRAARTSTWAALRTAGTKIRAPRRRSTPDAGCTLGSPPTFPPNSPAFGYSSSVREDPMAAITGSDLLAKSLVAQGMEHLCYVMDGPMIETECADI